MTSTPAPVSSRSVVTSTCRPHQDCQTPAGNAGLTRNNTQSDPVDNFAGTEVLKGVNDVGSGNGQAQLCGTIGSRRTRRSTSPVPLSRWGGSCPTEVQLGYAKDGVPAVDFPSIEPELYGTASGYDTLRAGRFTSYNMTTGATVLTSFPPGGVGPVAAGWLPGDSYTCVHLTPERAPVHRVPPFRDLDNSHGGGGDPACCLPALVSARVEQHRRGEPDHRLGPPDEPVRWQTPAGQERPSVSPSGSSV